VIQVHHESITTCKFVQCMCSVQPSVTEFMGSCQVACLLKVYGERTQQPWWSVSWTIFFFCPIWKESRPKQV